MYGSTPLILFFPSFPSLSLALPALAAMYERCFALPMEATNLEWELLAADRSSSPSSYDCRRRTLGQNHKKHSIALLGPFVLKKGPNRGIKCQFDILEKKPKGGPFYIQIFFISDFTQVSCANFLANKDSKDEI